MSNEKNYISINKQSWNKRTNIHIDSEFYDVDRFLKGNSSLNSIELDMLGDVKGLSILHLQCHFGQDSISLSRLGANVTAVDFSDQAIEQAKKLSDKDGNFVNFICCDVYDLPNHLNKKFDIVFTSYGTIGWLPDISKWASIVSRFLKSTGKFVFVEFHPVVWMFDDEFKSVDYRYFNDEPIETNESSYTEKEKEEKEKFITWNHALSEVIMALIQNDIKIEAFKEYDYSPYDCFSNTIKIKDKKYRIKHLDNKLPMVYSILAKK